ncbi:unnamed protein product [Prunus armeniaca]|uniref:Uncharacterized protein n=1 Tax=Prunus armeniaca TaxID=36596 RepID=A0A6J5XT74_PRUAR|nr:unnamed protein product [Prunus armeniaca]
MKQHDGDAGNRTPCLSHAKRALYHMSYVPVDVQSRLTLIFKRHRIAFESKSFVDGFNITSGIISQINLIPPPAPADLLASLL